MYEKKIAMGMALLDEKLPGWEDQVDLERLALNDCRRCVVGQLCGADDHTAYYKFWNQLQVWGILTYGEESPTSLDQACEYGFALPERTLCDDPLRLMYANLTEEWRDAILTRRAANEALAAELEAFPLAEVPELTGASV